MPRASREKPTKLNEIKQKIILSLRHFLEIHFCLLANSPLEHFSTPSQMAFFTSSKKYLITIATSSSLETFVEVHIPRVISPPVILTVLKILLLKLTNQLVSVFYSTFKVIRLPGIDITVTVDVFSLVTNKMTQAQIDLQNQLEQATADLTTRTLLGDSPVLYIDTSEPTPTNSVDQMEQAKTEHDTPKVPTPIDDTDRTHTTPPPPKKTI